MNTELERTIPQQRAQTPSAQASAFGGWHSDRDILTWGGPPIAAIIDVAKGVATQLTADRRGKPIHPARTVQAWANVNGSGEGNICNYLPSCLYRQIRPHHGIGLRISIAFNLGIAMRDG